MKTLNPKISILCVLTIALTFSLDKLIAQTDTIDATECSNIAIQLAVDLATSGGGAVVRIPAGDCIISNDVDFDLDDGDTLKILGAGTDKTILRNGDGIRIQFEQTSYGGSFIEFSGITFLSDTSDGAGSVKAIQLKGPDNFHIHHCVFNGRWHGFISLYKAQKGLIDHCLARNSVSPQGYYGILYNSYYQPKEESDEAFWAKNWDSDRNLLMGSDNSLFIEDCEFHNFHTAIELNWASFGKATIRHNTFNSHDAYNQVGWKAGAYFSELYNNTFINTGEETSGNCINIRTGGVIYNNTLQNFPITGHIWAYDTAFNYVYPPYTVLNNLFIWDNIYENCNYTEDAIIQNYGAPWVIMCGEGIGCDEGGYTGHLPLNDGDEIFIRSLQDGDAFFPYTAFSYPHPMVSGTDMPKEPHITSILTDKFYNPKITITPNPAVDNLTVNIVLLKEEKVKINICNLSGSIIKSVCDIKLAEGDHSIPVSTSDLIRGVYIADIQYANFHKSLKLILL